jgi:LemA protein
LPHQPLSVDARGTRILAAKETDMSGSTITLLILGAVALYAIYAYNALVKARQMVKEAWSGIDVQLKRRADLIPNLIETVKGYAGHEKDTLREVTEMRTRAQSVPAGDIAGRAAAEGMLGQALGRLMAVAEAYPDLKANENFLQLQQTLETTEGEIQMSRRYYNGSSRDLNVMVESFPSNFIANTFKFEKVEYFELENPDDRKVPQVSFNKS